MDQDGTWHGGQPSSKPHCARWGPSSPPPKRGRALQFSAHLYCGQRAGCIEMSLAMEVGLSPGDFVLDGDPAPYPKRWIPQFSAHVCCGLTAAWIKMPLGTEVGLGLRDRGLRDIVRCGPSYLRKRAPTPPNFWSMSIVAKWLFG